MLGTVIQADGLLMAGEIIVPREEATAAAFLNQYNF